MSEDVKIGEPMEIIKDTVSTANKGEMTLNIDNASKKPKVDRARATLTGYLATGTHGAHLVPMGYLEYLAGAYIDQICFKLMIKLQPLNHVIFDKLKLKVFAVFVPNRRVYKDADKFAAQRSEPLRQSSSQTLPFMTPSGQTMPLLSIGGRNINSQASTVWRDTVFYHYYGTPTIQNSPMTRFNVLPLRGYIAAYNDIFRDRRVQPEIREFDDATATVEERRQYWGFRNDTSTANITIDHQNDLGNTFIRRMSAEKNYWNSWRPDVLSNNDPVNNTSLQTHVVTQQMIDEFRQQAENINKSDAEVIAEIRGTKIARENECFIIGRKTIDIDMAVQPATAEAGTGLALGADGAISYTFADFELGMGKGFSHPKDGYIHYFYTLTMPEESMFIGGSNIEANKVNWDDFYRPGTKEIKDVPLLMREIHIDNGDAIAGWRRKGSEYFRHPNFVRGEFNFDGFLPNQSEQGRRNWAGFTTLTFGGTEARLPAVTDWIGLRSRLEAPDLLQNGLDYTDQSLRRILQVNGGNAQAAQFLRRAAHTLYLNGTVKVGITQPIDKAIANEFITWGEE